MDMPDGAHILALFELWQEYEVARILIEYII